MEIQMKLSLLPMAATRAALIASTAAHAKTDDGRNIGVSAGWDRPETAGQNIGTATLAAMAVSLTGTSRWLV
jgi:hypothetical protein